MSQEPLLSPLSARRQLGFLGTFDKKFRKLKKETERLKQASRDPKAQGGQLAASEIERVVRGLVGAGPVYGVDTITIWAKEALPRMEFLKNDETPPTVEDLEWLSSQIILLERLHGEAEGCAKQALANARDSSPHLPPPPPSPSQSPSHNSQIDDQLEDKMGWEIDPSPSEVPQARPSARPSSLGLAQVGVPVTSLVVVNDQPLRNQVTFALKNAGFQVQEVTDAATVIRLAEEESPDLIVVDVEATTLGGNNLVRDLSRDPLTDFIPVLRILPADSTIESGAICKPVDPAGLITVARKLSRHEPNSAGSEKSFRDLNLEELTEFVYSEIHAGVLGAATGPHTKESFPVLNKGPLVAAIWAVVARLRRVAAEGSEGNIRFLPTTHGPIGMMALDEAERVLDPTSTSVVDETDIAALHDLNAIVIDDDLDIRVVFEKVLSVAGMNVTVAANGAEGLAAIQNAPPDIVITDILMPEMDGWELATRLRWDFALKHIPIIMLSWKEDFLQRVRELNVDANGYMLKEMDRQQILTRVAGVLKPRFSLEHRLSQEGETTGRVERVGVVGILQAAMSMRPNCRITIRENWNYFEIDILDGGLVSVNRTGTDGSFASGIPALERLLGVSSGRFSIVHRVEISKQQFQDGSMAMIRQATRRLNELNNQIVDGNLVNIRELLLNQDVIDIYSKVIPHKLQGPLNHIADGESPRSIILSGSTSSKALETLILDLIRMGAVKEIINIENESKRNSRAEGMTSSALISAATKEKIQIEQETSNNRPTSLTIQLSEDDIREIAGAPSKGLLPFLAYQRRRLDSNVQIWQALTVICFMGFALVTFLLLNSNANSVDGSEMSVAEDWELSPTDYSKAALGTTSKTKAVQPPEAKREKTLATTPKKSPETAAGKEDRGKPIQTAAVTGPKKEVKAEPKKRENLEPAPKKNVKKKVPAEPVQNKGLLDIAAPPGVAPGQIRVSVDGRLRGKAPIRLRLAVGIHEIVYSLDGKRVIRMVRIKGGETKKIYAKKPK